MSVEAISWVLNHAPTDSPVSKLVLVALANHAHPDGTAAFPSVGTICRYTCLSERSVRQHLDALEKQGVIRRCDPRIVAAYIQRSDRRPVGYDIVMDGVQEMQVVPQRGAGDAANGVQEIPERGAGDAPEPSNKPSSEPHVERLVKIFAERLKETTPSGVALGRQTKEWGDSFRRLLRQGATVDQIETMVGHAFADPWWRRNIRTPMKLVQHWERLVVEKSSVQTQAQPIVDGRLDSAMTTVLNFVRLGKPREDIQHFIDGYPEFTEHLTAHWDRCERLVG